MNSCNTDIFFSNYYHLQSVRFDVSNFHSKCVVESLKKKQQSRGGTELDNGLKLLINTTSASICLLIRTIEAFGV